MDGEETELKPSDGFVLLYKRLEKGSFQWPKSEDDVRNITQQQLRWLMEGLSIKGHITVVIITFFVKIKQLHI